MRLYIISCLLLSRSILCQSLDFFKEDITFQLDKEYFRVNGYYWFANHSDKKIERLIYYPLDNSSGEKIIDSIGVLNLTDGFTQKISNETIKGFNFVIELECKDTAAYLIKYRQKLTGDSIRYILLSTRLWNKSLETAEYKLIVKNPVRVTNFSYEPDKIYIIQSEKIYYWKRDNFMPDTDMVFHFEYY